MYTKEKYEEGRRKKAEGRRNDSSGKILNFKVSEMKSCTSSSKPSATCPQTSAFPPKAEEKFKTVAANIYYSSILTLTTNVWTKTDTRLSLVLGFGLIYLTVKEPLLISIILSISLFFYCLNRIIKLIPWLHKIVNAKISFWHIAGLIIALTATLTVFELPAHAIFLSGLEEFLAGIAEESSVGGASTISPEAITLVFNAIRGVFLLLVGVAALFAYNQAQQGNDWRPIATQAGLAIGIILTIDVITFLFIGDGTGTAGGG